MTIEPVGFLPPVQPVLLGEAAPRAPGLGVGMGADVAPTDGGFARWFTQQAQRVDAQLGTADRQLHDLATGHTQHLHQVMIALEEARLSFQLLMQVRNRVLEAYQDVIRMQI